MSTIDEQLAELNKKISDLIKKSNSNYKVDYALYVFCIVAGLILSACVTISGMLDKGSISAILGVLVLVLISFDSAMAPGEKAQFYKQIEAAGNDLQDEVGFTLNISQEKIDAAVKKLATIRDTAAQGVPHGKGMKTIAEMYKTLPESNVQPFAASTGGSPDIHPG
jgi:hypothetical protein